MFEFDDTADERLAGGFRYREIFMSRDFRRFMFCASGVLLQGLLSTSAFAQTAPSMAGLDEVVVTAQRRSEKINDVPMTITVYSQEKLDQQGVKGIDDLSRVSPGVTFIRNGSGSSGNYNDEGSDISIRGIQSSAGASTTGVYVDDTPIQTRHLNFGTVNPYPALFDLERVEVLKGPQGTLFGAGSEGGTVRFITPEASLHDYQVYARAELGSIDHGGNNYDAGLAVGGPIIDGVLGFRVSASYREDGGWVDRATYAAPPSTPADYFAGGGGGATLYSGTPTVTGITEKNANWHDTGTFRAALKWVPMDDLTISPSFYMQSLQYNDSGAYWLNISDPANSHYVTGNQQRNPSTDPWYIAAVKAEWSPSWVHVTSNTSYFSRDQHSTSDYSQWFNTVFGGNQYPTAANAVSATFTDHQDNFSEELRVSSVDPKAFVQWTAGLYYAHVLEDSTEYIYNPAGVGGIVGSTPQTPIYNQPIFSALDKQMALFGEVSLNLTEKWKATAGVRASRIDTTAIVQEWGALNGSTAPDSPTAINSTSSLTETPVTPRFVLNYKATPDNLLYASASKGFRPGGPNARLPSNCGVIPPTTFTSDSLWLYEVGSKNTLMDRRVQLNASAYYLNWTNIQQFVYLACGLGFVPNLGEATGRGGDIELQWRASDALTLGATAAYTSTYFKQTVALPQGSGPPVPVVAQGDHLLAAPWNITANAEYTFASVEHKPYLRVDYQYSTAQQSLLPYLDSAQGVNSDPTQPGLPMINVLSARGGLHIGGADISVFAQNLLNYHTAVFVSRDYPTITKAPWNNGAVFDTNYFGRGLTPRTVGVTVTYRY